MIVKFKYESVHILLTFAYSNITIECTKKNWVLVNIIAIHVSSDWDGRGLAIGCIIGIGDGWWMGMGPIASRSMHENHKLIMHLNITPCMENCRILNHGIPDLDEPRADHRTIPCRMHGLRRPWLIVRRPSLLTCDQLGNRIIQQGVRRQGVRASLGEDTWWRRWLWRRLLATRIGDGPGWGRGACSLQHCL
jgi:hypothetical protein